MGKAEKNKTVCTCGAGSRWTSWGRWWEWGRCPAASTLSHAYPAIIQWRNKALKPVFRSVADPWNFGTDPGSASGSAEPYLWLMDPNPDEDPAIFVSNRQDANKKLIFIFFAYYFLAVLRIRDVYPGSRIQKQQQKTGVKKIFFVKPFLVATNFTKLNIILFLICLRKKFDPIFQEDRHWWRSV